jgi:hypothetical protein
VIVLFQESPWELLKAPSVCKVAYPLSGSLPTQVEVELGCDNQGLVQTSLNSIVFLFWKPGSKVLLYQSKGTVFFGGDGELTISVFVNILVELSCIWRINRDHGTVNYFCTI